jgi:nitrate reductase NapAB chaperone NapD
MDKIAKFLLVCDAKQTQILLDIIQKIQNLNFEGLDIKKIQ